MLVLVWSIAMAGIAAWAFMKAQPGTEQEFESITSPVDSTARGLAITDIIVNCKEAGGCLLDFRLLNESEKTIIVNRVKLKVIEFTEISTRQALTFSALYEDDEGFDISELRETGAEAEVPVSNSLPASQADRFGVSLTATQRPPEKEWFVKLEVHLLTSQGTIKGPDIQVNFLNPSQALQEKEQP